MLSAEHGLIQPLETIAWYDKTLKGASIHEKRTWSARVLGSIDLRVGLSAGDVVEIHAGSDYRDFGLVQALL